MGSGAKINKLLQDLFFAVVFGFGLSSLYLYSLTHLLPSAVQILLDASFYAMRLFELALLIATMILLLRMHRFFNAAFVEKFNFKLPIIGGAEVEFGTVTSAVLSITTAAVLTIGLSEFIGWVGAIWILVLGCGLAMQFLFMIWELEGKPRLKEWLSSDQEKPDRLAVFRSGAPRRVAAFIIWLGLVTVSLGQMRMVHIMDQAPSLLYRTSGTEEAVVIASSSAGLIVGVDLEIRRFGLFDGLSGTFRLVPPRELMGADLR